MTPDPIERPVQSWQRDPPEEDGWYVVGWAADSGRPAYACIKVVGNPNSPYVDGVRWLLPALDIPPLPEEEP